MNLNFDVSTIVGMTASSFDPALSSILRFTGILLALFAYEGGWADLQPSLRTQRRERPENRVIRKHGND